MRSGRRTRFFSVLGIMLLGTSAAVAQVPVTVSPGTPTGAKIGDPCPTFSWGAMDGATAYELVVYRLGQEGDEPEPVLRQELPGSASGWTPSLERCLERGGRYAWSVRAQDEETTSEWSAPALFRVAAGPSQREFEEALQVVHRYLKAEGVVGPPVDSREAGDDGAVVSQSMETASPPTQPVVGTTQLTVDGGVTATSFTGDGSTLANLGADKLTTGTVPLERGGTGASTAAGARTNLDVAQGLHTADTTCSGVDCDLRDFSLVSCDTVDTDASGNLICGSDAIGASSPHPIVDLTHGELCQARYNGTQLEIFCDGRFTLCDALNYRYFDVGDGTIKDCVTGLFWLKQASCDAVNPGGNESDILDAEQATGLLEDGTCGLTDLSVRGEWRLPAVSELCSGPIVDNETCPTSAASDSLVDTSIGGVPMVVNAQGTGAWKEDNAFVQVLSSFYWGVDSGGDFWQVNLATGIVQSDLISGPTAFVWPVREALGPRPKD